MLLMQLIKVFQGQDYHGKLSYISDIGKVKPMSILRTMFELNKPYGWSKFIVVAPSISM